MKNRIMIMIFSLMLMPMSAFADTDANALSSAISGITDFLTGDIAKMAGVLAIVGVGYATLVLGKLDKGRALGMVVGIGIIFSAAYIFNLIHTGA